jgi:hypothetical protein
MRILHYLSDQVWKLDAWLLDRFQHIANLAYTRWDTSPYAIAARCFHVAAMAVSGLWLTKGLDVEMWKSSPGTQVFMIFLGALVLASLAGESWLAEQKHLRWQQSGSMEPPSERYPAIRLMWFIIFLISGGPAFILSLVVLELTLNTVLVTLWDGAMVCGFYLLSCAPPTRLEKKQDFKDMVPNLG